MVTMSKEYRKEYYEKNKSRIIETMNVETKCAICGCTVQKCKLKRHQKTRKCKDKLNEGKQNDIQQLKDEIKELRNIINKTNQNVQKDHQSNI